MRKGLLFLALIVVAAAVIGFQTGAYDYFQRLFSSSRSPSSTLSCGYHNSTNPNATCIEVNTIINYGNRTRVWFNHTHVPADWNFLNVTMFLTNGRVHLQYFDSLKENQVLGINGVDQYPSNTWYWSLWKFCPGYGAWALTPVGVDRIALSNGGVYGWYFQSQTGTQYPPVPGAMSTAVLDINAC